MLHICKVVDKNKKQKKRMTNLKTILKASSRNKKDLN